MTNRHFSKLIVGVFFLTFFACKDENCHPSLYANRKSRRASIHGIKYNTQSIYFGTNSPSKDTVTVEMWCIDREVHTYFNTLNQLQETQSGTPTNPISNIKGGALGYFSAHSVRSKKVMIP